jgi:hypothetical protein
MILIPIVLLVVLSAQYQAASEVLRPPLAAADALAA